jgi:glutaredoxin
MIGARSFCSLLLSQGRAFVLLKKVLLKKVLLKKTPTPFKTLLAGVPKDAKRCQTMSDSPEDARIAACTAREITLYTRPGCHLCEEAKALLEPILREFGAALREVDIDQDAVLQQRYSTDIPVIFVGAHKAAKHRIDPGKFRRQLSDALRVDS